MIDTTGIDAFLLDRIAEDEAVARFAAEVFGIGYSNRYNVRPGGPIKHVVRRPYTETSWDLSDLDADCPDSEEQPGSNAHRARWDPARVLIECDVKRRIIADHADLNADWHDGGDLNVPAVCRRCEDRTIYDALAWPCPTLRLLALPYAAHPDYQQSWQP